MIVVISFYVHNHLFAGVVITMGSPLSKVFLSCEKEHDFCPLSETSVKISRNAFYYCKLSVMTRFFVRYGAIIILLTKKVLRIRQDMKNYF